MYIDVNFTGPLHIKLDVTVHIVQDAEVALLERISKLESQLDSNTAGLKTAVDTNKG